MKQVLSNKERRQLLQPLNPKTGYINEEYNKYYGAKNNPYVGTERDKSTPKWAIDSRTGTKRRT